MKIDVFVQKQSGFKEQRRVFANINNNPSNQSHALFATLHSLMKLRTSIT